MARENAWQKIRDKKQKLISHIKKLYAEGQDSKRVLEILDAQGVRKKNGKRLDLVFLQQFRARNHIRLPKKV